MTSFRGLVLHRALPASTGSCYSIPHLYMPTPMMLCDWLPTSKSCPHARAKWFGKAPTQHQHPNKVPVQNICLPVSFAEGALVACKLVCGLGCFPIHTRRQQLAHAWFQACSCRMPCHTPALTRITIPAGHTSWPPASSTPRTRCLC